MPNITFNKHQYLVEGSETVLDTLLRNKVNFPYSCKNGTCQSCLARMIKGQPPEKAQIGLKPTLVASNYFLPCQCQPDSDITISLPEDNVIALSATILSMSKFNHNVLQVILSLEQSYDFKAGQYINLVVPNNLVRSYSIARVNENKIELHIKLIPDGQMSSWLCQQAKIGTAVSIRGPMGHCYYHNPQNKSYPIVLACTGTGLAPLTGIIHDALAKKHQGKIILIHGGVIKNDLYLDHELNVLQQNNKNFTYIPSIINASQSEKSENLETVLVGQLDNICNSAQVFICGPAETTNKLKTKVFISGVPSASIYSDAFITTKS